MELLKQSILENIQNMPDELSILENVSLSDKNWFRTGGNATYFCEPQSYKSFSEALNFAQLNNQEIFILGEGANILISDNGFDGLVIKPKLQSIRIISQIKNKTLVEADCGIKFQNLIDFCLNNNLIGLEEFSGIPGMVGGAIFMNIHYFEYLLGNSIVSAKIIEKNSGKIEEVANDWFNFGYNSTTLHEKKYYLLSATFELKKVSKIEASFARGRSCEIIRHRNKRYPLSHTCGSFFRNFTPTEVENEKTGKQIIFVAYYLDKLGFKGTLSYGDAIVSHQHANMIINKGKATSNDIIQLAKIMQKAVTDNFGIYPKTECQFIGFKENILL